MTTNKPLKDPEEIRKHVGKASLFLGGEYNLTINNVPRIILHTQLMSFSIVYVARSDQWKVFYPFPSKEQKREYFQSLEQVKQFCYAPKCIHKENTMCGGYFVDNGKCMADLCTFKKEELK